MIDFTNCLELNPDYGGSEKKKKLQYGENIYLVKFPDPIREKNNPLSYMNNQFSEYIGCHIFESVDIRVQDTLLGIYKEDNGKIKIVVACKDFTEPGRVLTEFSKFALSTTSLERKISTKIEDVYDVIDYNSSLINKKDIKDKFWDMFVVDALIGNKDRHLDNWGLICDVNGVEFAPVYDCGSCLHALLDDETCKRLLADKTDFKNEVYNIHSCYSYQGKRINYAEFFKKPIEPLQEAILRIVPKIDLEKIKNIIEYTPGMSDVRKEFLFKSIAMRKEMILDYALKRCLKPPLKSLITSATTSKSTLNHSSKNDKSKEDVCR